MGLNIPPAGNYLTPLTSLPTLWGKEPIEGDRIVPVEIDWGSYLASGLSCVSFNLFGNAAQTISQICAITIDNSNCSVPVIFIFPDTAQTYEVKALTPVATFPVFTNQTQFYVNAPGALVTDVTRFGVLNGLPYPVALAESPQIIPVPVPASVTAFSISLATGSVNAQVIPVGVKGTLTAYSISFFFPSTPAAGIVWSLVDGTHTLMAGVTGATEIAQQSGLVLTFTGGIRFVTTAAAGPAGSQAIVNLYYTVP